MLEILCVTGVTIFVVLHENSNYDQRYTLERHAPFIGEIFAEILSIAMRTVSPDILQAIV
jgi:hypothetical protein